MSGFKFSITILLTAFCLTISESYIIGQTPVESPAVKVSDNQVANFQNRDEKYRIGYQDTLTVQIFRHPELAQRVNVNPNGTISLFRLDTPIVAVCKTEAELADDIKVAYKKDYLRNPEVQVIATEQKSQAFSVIGAVEKPGYYFINRKMHLLELLSFAGGPSKEAGSRVLVARTGSASECKAQPDASAVPDSIAMISFKLKDILEGKSTLIMQPGDVISVMPADVVFVYGNVNKQGQVKITEPITLTQAIASSEGLKPATKKSNVRILRQKPGSLEREEFVFDLNEIDKRKVNDPYLQPNDIVAVSEDKVLSILNSVKNGLTQGIPSIFYRL